MLNGPCSGSAGGNSVVNLIALAEGGHVRTGLEDTIYYRPGELATSNAQLVARIVDIARELGRPIATPDEARALIGREPKGGDR